METPNFDHFQERVWDQEASTKESDTIAPLLITYENARLILDEVRAMRAGMEDKMFMVLAKQFIEKSNEHWGDKMSLSDRGLLFEFAQWLDNNHTCKPLDAMCEDCGKLYSNSTWIDCTVPDSQWLAIHPAGEGGLLCGACMIERLRKLPGATAIRMYADTGHNPGCFCDYCQGWHE